MHDAQTLNTRVRKELLGVRYEGRHCCSRTELLGLLSILSPDIAGDGSLALHTNDVLAAQRLLYLFREELGDGPALRLHQEPSSTPGHHRIFLKTAPKTLSMLDCEKFPDFFRISRHHSTRRRCCALAFLRALYWKGGFISSPRSGFHLEFILPSGWPDKACDRALSKLGLSLSSTKRRGRTVLYSKASETISSLLGFLGAPQTLLLLQDVIITKEIKNNVNRMVNCDVSNLKRSSRSSASDVEMLCFLDERKVLESLPAHLQLVAQLRCEFPGMSLAELGRKVDPPLSKAGVYHRLRRLRKEADIERERA